MKKSALTLGVIMILVGAVLLALQLKPEWADFVQWPMIILGIGVLFLISAVITGNGDFAIPGCINAGLGGIFYYQTLSSDWASWSFIWTLIPAFVGLGILLANLINREPMDRGGLTLLLISLLAFAVFYTAQRYSVGFDLLWPALLVLGGILLITRNIRRRVRD